MGRVDVEDDPRARFVAERHLVVAVELLLLATQCRMVAGSCAGNDCLGATQYSVFRMLLFAWRNLAACRADNSAWRLTCPLGFWDLRSK